MLNKILYIYEQAISEHVDLTEEILAKSERKKIYYSVEGFDEEFDEYIIGERVNLDII